MSTQHSGPIATPATPATRGGMVAWAMYDWANSAFTTLIITFVFAAYFSQGIVGDDVKGQALWGYVAGISSFLVAVLSPILGAIADSGGPRKRWILAFSVICIAATALLWFAKPTPAAIPLAIILVIIANVGFEFGIVFNNAMLGDLAPPDRIGRWSGWAWGLGYFGGLAALVVMLVGFVQTETPWFGIGKEEAANIRVVGPLVAIWFAIFVIPFFVFTPDRPSSGEPMGTRIRKGLSGLGHTLANLRQHGNVVRFMLARMLYNDGVVTIFAIGGVYAAGRFGMTTSELIQFGILLNVTAGLGAFGFAWIDDW
ncbi:MAG: MFS transporter, partial [Proteobacteria bacterium]|nr:MFS transporter [Pseudomonadota bacterium]